MPPRHCITAPPHHRVTVSVSHLPCPLPPNQSVICLAPYHCITVSLCHCISQSFALPPATKPVSHLPCPLPPDQSVICLAPYHCVTASPHHRVTTSPRHCVSQSFALPPATKPVSHLPCPLPPDQSVICLAPYHHVTASPHHHTTASPHHHVTVLVSHLPCPLPLNQSVICLAPCHQTSQSFALPPTTTSLRPRITVPPHHRVTVLVSHLPCPLPPNQSVICLAHCHQTSQSFALPPTTASPRHCVSQSFALPPAPCPCHQASQSFALPPATKPVSHLPCPLPLCPRVTTSPCHRATASLC